MAMIVRLKIDSESLLLLQFSLKTKISVNSLTKKLIDIACHYSVIAAVRWLHCLRFQAGPSAHNRAEIFTGSCS